MAPYLLPVEAYQISGPKAVQFTASIPISSRNCNDFLLQLANIYLGPNLHSTRLLGFILSHLLNFEFHGQNIRSRYRCISDAASSDLHGLLRCVERILFQLIQEYLLVIQKYRCNDRVPQDLVWHIVLLNLHT
jgi:hypothetical protein